MTIPATEPKKVSWLTRLKSGLQRSSTCIATGIEKIFTRHRMDYAALEALEELLIEADFGVAVAAQLSFRLRKEKFDREMTADDVRRSLVDKVVELLEPLKTDFTINAQSRPHVIMVLGVNGSGKTTTVAKLAARLKAEGKRVLCAGADTFRAAAVEQLAEWCRRVDVPLIAGSQGDDPAAIAYQAMAKAQTDNSDVLIIDTAGRLQNKRGLMDELTKMARVLKKLDPEAPHDTVLVVDATIGQNALAQVQAFKDAAPITGLVLTKLDGSAKGGVVVALAEKYRLPIYGVGVGEAIDDLLPFDANNFAENLLRPTV